MKDAPLLRIAIGTLFLAYGLVLHGHTSFAVGGSDSSGYHNAARLLSAGRASDRIRGLDRLGLGPEFAPAFVPMGFIPGPRPGRMSPSYPPGLPLQIAAAGRIGGPHAAFLVPPLSGLMALVLMYLLGRELGLSRMLAVAGSTILAFAPVFVFQEVAQMSDVPATAWALAAVFAAYRARRAPVWSLAAGAAFAIGVLVRPMNVLLLPALLFVLPLRARSLALFAVGGAPFAAFLLLYNQAAFGSPWRTGYGSLLGGGLAVGNFPPRAQYYALWLARTMSPILLAGWIAMMANRRVAARDRVALFAWFSAFFLFYCFYVVYDAWWYTRFLLPGLPAVVLGALLCVRDFVLKEREPVGRRRLLVAVAAILVAAVLYTELRFIDENRVHKVYKGERIYPNASEMARRRLPGNAIVASMQMSGALHYYTDLTYTMWTGLTPELFAELRGRTEARGHRWYALLFPFEIPEVHKNLPGDWRPIDRTGDVVLWELPPLSR